jgi:hypothetical protein
VTSDWPANRYRKPGVSKRPLEELNLFDLACEEPGLCLFPPNKETFSPEDWNGLSLKAAQERFCYGVLRAAEVAAIDQGTEKIPGLAYYGLAGLVEAETVSALWPTLEMLVEFEQDVLEHVSRMLTRKARIVVRGYLKEWLGLKQQVATHLIQLALNRLNEQMAEPVEFSRALLLSQVEDALQTAHDCGDMATVRQLLRIKVWVYGFSRAEQETPMQVLIQSIGHVEKTRHADALLGENSPKRIELLPGAGDFGPLGDEPEAFEDKANDDED